MENISKYQQIQDIAKTVMRQIKSHIRVGMSEAEIVQFAENQLLKKGIDSFWYHGIGALVFIGKRTKLSISGKEYSPTNTKVRMNDLVTIDLSPQKNNIWGDYARSFEFVNGTITSNTTGINKEKSLHRYLMKIAHPEMTFDSLFSIMNKRILEMKCKNLDFLNNIGHSIERNLNKRIYVEKGNENKLKGKIFTFEPHIRYGKFGYKHEDIYFFKNQKLARL